MQRKGPERRKHAPDAQRESFGSLVRTVLRNRVREARSGTTHWTLEPNLAWARWPREDGRYVYVAIRRRMDWLTGEVGVSPDPVDLDLLPEVRALGSPPFPASCRIQLGYLLHDQDMWWSSGGTEKSLLERMEWIAQQMQLRMHAFLAGAIDPAA